MADVNELAEQLWRELPDPRTAELLFKRLTAQNKSIENSFQRNPALLSDVLTLAAWSPLLATTLENNPDYVNWLQRERTDLRVRTREDLGESLGRFALVNSQVDPHVMLARFRRRELLRTYFHDIRRARTIVETTEELSNLADAVLEYGLKLCRQELDNKYGSPQVIDAQQRISSAEYCVIALGKLGSWELNYASDIDLVFLFSHEGQTSGGARGHISNREYFVKLSERLLRVVGEPVGEGASYRIDVRLRPYGREGALACSLDEAVNYYERAAQDWELQALIRARAAAGSQALYSTFSQRIINRVFRPNISVGNALANVRLAKQKIDVQRERDEKGFNVKLGRGGIREIEFIAQALQIAFGGSDSWLRTPHTLISLGRLADRDLITEREHGQLSDAYHFLRALEHRLQMEHGLQTHTLPSEPARRELVGKRMDFSGETALNEFDTALTTHTENVHAAFVRVFRDESSVDGPLPIPRQASIDDSRTEPDAAAIRFAASIFAEHFDGRKSTETVNEIADLLRTEADASLNPHRAVSIVTRVAASVDKESAMPPIDANHISRLVRLCGVSEFFGEIFANRPQLIHELSNNDGFPSDEYQDRLSQAAIEPTFHAALDTLRRAWSRLFVRIGARDCQREVSLSQVNTQLTQLAIASINASLQIAARELERRYPAADQPTVAVLGLGRLASGGVDYGSDLDVIVIYDNTRPSPVTGLTHEEAYSRLVEFLVTALSSITHEGYLYRVDLRLRPDGQKGPIVTGAQPFLDYLKKRAAIWEWLAYVKLRAVAGDVELGRTIESQARKCVHQLAAQADGRQLLDEASRVRSRLERERGSRRGGINIKHGAGGMLDVYFATRYLQLRDNVADDDADRTTLRTLQKLCEASSLPPADFQAMQEGYELLRAVDHQLRLTIGRSATLPAEEQPAFTDIARRLQFESAKALSAQLHTRMSGIRESYERIMRG